MGMLQETRPLNILFVEPGAAAPGLIIDRLAACGFQVGVARASDLVELDAALSAPVDVVLADLTPAGLNACRVLEFLHSRKLDIPMVVLCAPEEEELAISCLAQGAADYVITGKMLRLGFCIDRIIEERRLRASVGAVNRDIAEQKRIEVALRESEARMRLAEKTGRIGSFEWDVQTEEMIWSETIETILGLEEGEGSFDVLTQRIFPDDLESILAQLREAAKARREDLSVQFRVTRPDGEYRWVDSRSKILYAQEGAVSRLVGVMIDITERKQMEDELRQTAHSLSEAERIGQLGSFRVDVDTQKVWGSAEAMRIYGFKDAITDRAQSRAVVLPEYRDILERANQALLKGEEGHEVEIKIARESDGVVRDVRLNAEYDPQTRKILGVVQDVTERKQAEEALLRSEAKFRAVVENSHDGIIFCDANAVVTYRSPSYQWINGYSDQERVGQSGFESIHPEDRSVVRQMWLHVLARPGEPVKLEFRSQHKNGKWVWIESTAVNLLNIPDVSHVIITSRDITERKLAEETLRESESIYRKAIEAMNAVPYRQVFRSGLYPDVADFAFLGEGIERLTGYTAEEFTDKLFDSLVLEARLIDELAPYAFDEAVKLVRTGTLPYWKCEFLIKTKDGKKRWLFEAAVDQLDENGVDKGSFGVYQDITAQKLAEEEIRRQAAYSRTLAELTGRLSTAQDLETVMHQVFLSLQSALGLTSCVFYLWDYKKQTLQPFYKQGLDENIWNRLPALALPAGMETTLPDQVFSLADQERTGIGRLVLHRMENQGQMVGAIAIPDNGLSSYAGMERSLVDAFARQAAITIVNLRLYGETRSRAAELEKLTEVSASLRQARTLAEIVPLLVHQTIQVLNADTGTLLLFDDKTYGVVDQQQPEWQELIGGLDLDLLQKQAWTYFHAGQEEHSPLLRESFQWKKIAIVSFTGAVIRSVESKLGLLLVGYNRKHEFLEDEQRLILAIADMAGNAIHRTNMMDTLEQRVQVRMRELKVLYEIARAASQLTDLETILDQSLARVMEVYNVRFGMIQMLSEDGEMLDLVAHAGLPESAVSHMNHISLKGSIIEQVVVENRAVLSLDMFMRPNHLNPYTEIPPKVYLGAPIRAKGKILGVIGIAHPDPIRFNVEEIALLETIASQIGISVESARLRKRSEEAAILEERQRLARDLHDSVTQSLFSLNMMAEGCRKSAANASTAQVVEWFAELGASAHQALKDMRLMLYELRPSTIEHDGLVTAIHRRLEAVEGRSGVKSQFKVEGDPSMLSIADEIELYHIAQEALNNALKHAQATSVAILLAVTADEIRMDIDDDGVGFAVSELQTEGMGLVSMLERAKRMGGRLKIESDAGQGTRLHLIKRGN